VLSFVACDCILNVLTTFMASILDPLDYDQVHFHTPIPQLKADVPQRRMRGPLTVCCQPLLAPASPRNILPLVCCVWQLLVGVVGASYQGAIVVGSLIVGAWVDRTKQHHKVPPKKQKSLLRLPIA
jgi:hypothetical protein